MMITDVLCICVLSGMETDILMPQGLHAWNIRTFMDFLATHRFNSIRLPLSLQVGRWLTDGL